MPKVCSVCTHPEAEAINISLLSGRASLRDIAGKYGLSLSAVHRHKQHLPAQLVACDEGREAGNPSNVMLRIMELEKRANGIYAQATEAQDRRTALNALKELREIVTLYGRLAGELQTQTIHQHLHVSPEWVSMRQTVLSVLKPYPEARAALIKALGGVEDGQ